MLFMSRLLLAIQYGVALFFIRKKIKGLGFPLGLTITTFTLCGGAYYSMVPAFSEASGNGLGIYYVWYIIIGIEVGVVTGTASIWRKLSFKKTHLMERLGLLTLIIIGEGAIGVTKTVAKLMSKSGLTFDGCFLVIFIVLILTFLFILYFDNTTETHFGSIRQLINAALHFPLHLGIVGIVEGSQQVALARYVFKQFGAFQDTVTDACLTAHLDGAALTAPLIATVKGFKLDTKLESKDQVPVILDALYAVGNATGICSAANVTAGSTPPEAIQKASTDVLGGLFESTGVKVGAGEDAFELARSAYFTLYIYYWASVLFALLSFAAIFWVVSSKERGTNMYNKLALGSRILVVVVAAGLGFGAASHLFIYNFLRSDAVLPVVAGLLFAVICCDRIGRHLTLGKVL
ncbi:Low temperature requirement A [Neofusicoccum parvum]|uniref:Low temperature requirement A n=1 Tax=Neofusicoccum parvum TaxID=310453 RepID=A0ACB5S4E4_9PEZI|nr:Low temperature requirement A [Neofusicoccum parvum]GME64359.1 Low temperature requirement A [Neofusicoccum parvum]